jgi:hypothetical protein
VQALLFAAGITVTPMATQTRDEYNNFNCNYQSAFSYGGSPTVCASDDLDCLADYHSWDLSISQTWGPPYDPTSKLWDMTHLWCSGESDAPAVINMQSMTFSTFRSTVRGLSNIRDQAARETAYTTVLQTLHDEAVFLPITAKRQTAATNVRVSGFKFGYMEFDLPLANLYPTTSHSASFEVTIGGSLTDITDAKRTAHKTAMASQLGVDSSRITITYTAGSVVMSVTVSTDTADTASAMTTTMSGLTSSALGTALGETVSAVSKPLTNAPVSSSSNTAGIAVAAAFAALFLLCVIGLIMREKQGKPIFYNLDAKPYPSAGAA